MEHRLIVYIHVKHTIIILVNILFNSLGPTEDACNWCELAPNRWNAYQGSVCFLNTFWDKPFEYLYYNMFDTCPHKQIYAYKSNLPDESYYSMLMFTKDVRFYGAESSNVRFVFDPNSYNPAMPPNLRIPISIGANIENLDIRNIDITLAYYSGYPNGLFGYVSGRTLGLDLYLFNMNIRAVLYGTSIYCSSCLVFYESFFLHSMVSLTNINFYGFAYNFFPRESNELILSHVTWDQPEVSAALSKIYAFPFTTISIHVHDISIIGSGIADFYSTTLFLSGLIYNLYSTTVIITKPRRPVDYSSAEATDFPNFNGLSSAISLFRCTLINSLTNIVAYGTKIGLKYKYCNILCDYATMYAILVNNNWNIKGSYTDIMCDEGLASQKLCSKILCRAPYTGPDPDYCYVNQGYTPGDPLWQVSYFDSIKSAFANCRANTGIIFVFPGNYYESNLNINLIKGNTLQLIAYNGPGTVKIYGYDHIISLAEIVFNGIDWIAHPGTGSTYLFNPDVLMKSIHINHCSFTSENSAGYMNFINIGLYTTDSNSVSIIEDSSFMFCSKCINFYRAPASSTFYVSSVIVRGCTFLHVQSGAIHSSNIDQIDFQDNTCTYNCGELYDATTYRSIIKTSGCMFGTSWNIRNNIIEGLSADKYIGIDISNPCNANNILFRVRGNQVSGMTVAIAAYNIPESVYAMNEIEVPILIDSNLHSRQLGYVNCYTSYPDFSGWPEGTYHDVMVVSPYYTGTLLSTMYCDDGCLPEYDYCDVSPIYSVATPGFGYIKFSTIASAYAVCANAGKTIRLFGTSTFHESLNFNTILTSGTIKIISFLNSTNIDVKIVGHHTINCPINSTVKYIFNGIIFVPDNNNPVFYMSSKSCSLQITSSIISGVDVPILSNGYNHAIYVENWYNPNSIIYIESSIIKQFTYGIFVSCIDPYNCGIVEILSNTFDIIPGYAIHQYDTRYVITSNIFNKCGCGIITEFSAILITKTISTFSSTEIISRNIITDPNDPSVITSPYSCSGITIYFVYPNTNKIPSTVLIFNEVYNMTVGIRFINWTIPDNIADRKLYLRQIYQQNYLSQGSFHDIISANEIKESLLLINYSSTDLDSATCDDGCPLSIRWVYFVVIFVVIIIFVLICFCMCDLADLIFLQFI